MDSKEKASRSRNRFFRFLKVGEGGKGTLSIGNSVEEGVYRVRNSAQEV